MGSSNGSSKTILEYPQLNEWVSELQKRSSANNASRVQLQKEELVFDDQVSLASTVISNQLIAEIREIIGPEIEPVISRQINRFVNHQFRRIIQNKPVEVFILSIPLDDIKYRFEAESSDFVSSVNSEWCQLSKESGIRALIEGPTQTKAVKARSVNFRFTLSRIEISEKE